MTPRNHVSLSSQLYLLIKRWHIDYSYRGNITWNEFHNTEKIIGYKSVWRDLLFPHQTGEKAIDGLVQIDTLLLHHSRNHILASYSYYVLTSFDSASKSGAYNPNSIISICMHHDNYNRSRRCFSDIYQPFFILRSLGFDRDCARISKNCSCIFEGHTMLLQVCSCYRGIPFKQQLHSC